MVARINRSGSVDHLPSNQLETNLHRLRAGRIAKRGCRTGPPRMRSREHLEHCDEMDKEAWAQPPRAHSCLHTKEAPTNATFARRAYISSSALPEPDILSNIDSCGLCMASQYQQLSSHSVNGWCSHLHYLEQTHTSKSPFEIQPSALPIHQPAKYLFTSQFYFNIYCCVVDQRENI